MRNRLRVFANERGTTITELLEVLAGRELTEAEREQRAAEAARELGIEYTEQVQQAGQDAWAKIRVDWPVAYAAAIAWHAVKAGEPLRVLSPEPELYVGTGTTLLNPT
ncbi:hypothetical protein GCM10009647_081170 [Streptomyces sanglieri]|uniref:Uncharacterized protein n=1 Tax=Streptomyces sanglieri TaxID=193460 RepID=A0ABW2WRZ3_9ACTN|nr:hypothetical protein [Streptomyces sp. Wh19]MDV9198909.1 hypothetical protein [Streptomyces sp. Wh19]